MNIILLLVTLYCHVMAHWASAITEESEGTWGPSNSSRCRVVKSEGIKWFNLTEHVGSEFEDVLYTVNCSLLHLRQIPVPLPVRVGQISHLFLENNKIRRFPGNIFKNFTNLVHLSISQNYVEVGQISSYLFSGLHSLKTLRMSQLGCTYMAWREPMKFDKPEMVFSPMVNLQFLDIGGTCYDIPNLTNALKNVSSSLTILLMNKVFWTSFTTSVWILDKSFTQCLAHTKLKELSLEYNTIVVIKHGSFHLLPHLEKVLVRENYLMGDIGIFIELIFLVNITTIDVGRKYRDHMHSSRRNSFGKALLDSYQSSQYDENNLRDILLTKVHFSLPVMNVTSLEKLKILRIDNIFVRIPEINFQILKICWINHLEWLDVSHTYVQNVIGTALCMFKLKFLIMKYFHTDSFDSKVFYQMPRLEKLDLQGSSGEVIFKNESASTIFKYNKELRILSLSQCYIKKIPFSIFQWSTNLHKLDLSRNLFKSTLFDIRSLTKLQYLDISYNSIRFLNETFINDLNNIAKLRRGKLQLNLNGNPLFCGCSNKNSLDNLMKPVAVFDVVGFMNGTHRPSCVLDNGTLVHLYDGIKHLQAECMAHVELVTLTFIYPLALLTMLMVSIVYR